MMRICCCLLLGSVLLLLAGCGGGNVPSLAKVEGVLLDGNGEPLDGVLVMFLPDPEAEVFGKPAEGETDANGKFVLHYDGDENQPGTAVGMNRVILKDIKAIRSSRDDEPIGRRYNRKYLAAKTTDLSFDVKDEDGQTFEIKLDLPDE